MLNFKVQARFFSQSPTMVLYKGYDIDLIEFISDNTTIPIIQCGGCSSFDN